MRQNVTLEEIATAHRNTAVQLPRTLVNQFELHGRRLSALQQDVLDTSSRHAQMMQGVLDTSSRSAQMIQDVVSFLYNAHDMHYPYNDNDKLLRQMRFRPCSLK